MRPHRWQSTRLRCPWDSPGKNTGVGCHFLLQCMKVKSESKVAQSCPTLSDPMECSLPGSSTHGIFQARGLEWSAIAFSNREMRNLQLSGIQENESESHSVLSDSWWPHGLYSPWNSPGQNTGIGNHSLLQGIFPTQGSNPGLAHCRWILYQLSHKGSPTILEWAAYSFSSRSSWLRNLTGISCIAGGSFTN